MRVFFFFVIDSVQCSTIIIYKIKDIHALSLIKKSVNNNDTFSMSLIKPNLIHLHPSKTHRDFRIEIPRYSPECYLPHRKKY